MAAAVVSAVANAASVFGIFQASRHFKESVAEEVAYAERDYQQTKVFENTEMERDIWSQLSAKINNQLLAVTLFIGSSFGQAVEGVIPSEATSAYTAVWCFSVALALSQVLLVISFVFAYKNQALVNTFRNPRYAGKEHRIEKTLVEDFYNAECKQFETCSGFFLFLGVGFLMLSSGILICLRFYFQHSNQASAFTYIVSCGLGFVVTLILVCKINVDAEKTRTGVEFKRLRKKYQDDTQKIDKEFHSIVAK